MKTVPSGLQTHLNGEVTTVATCILITRTDAVQLAFTDHDADIVSNSVTYKSALSYDRTAVRTSSDMSVDNVEVQGIIDSTEISDDDLRAGKYDAATVEIFLVNRASPNDVLKLRSGVLGKVTLGKHRYQAELRGLTAMLQVPIGDVYQPTCRADLGDAKCGIDLAALAVSATVTGVTSRRIFAASSLTQAGPVVKTYTASTISFLKGSQEILDSASGFGVFATHDCIVVSGSIHNDVPHFIKSLTTAHIFVSQSTNDIITEPAGNAITLTSTVLGYFDRGYVEWLTGNNAGLKGEVKEYSGPSAAQVTLFLPAPYDIQVGDTFKIYPGCDKRDVTCLGKFNNMVNFRGENLVPGQNAMLVYADAK